MHRHRASTLFSAAMVVGLVAIAAACGGQSSSTSAGVLRVANDAGTGSASTMDPYDGNRFWPAINMVFDRLIGVDKDFTPIPELATKWESNADLTEWTLTLRDGVKFHDGSTFDSADAVYSIDRMIDPEFDSPVRAVLGIISKAEAIDATTLKLTLSAGEADLPVLLADYRALMTPEGSKDSVGKAPIGTGPFTMTTFDPEGTSKLTANPDYFLGAPKLASIEIPTIADSTSATQALAGGQVDLLLSTDAKSTALFADPAQFTVQRIPSGDWNAIDFRVDQKPFDDPRVRKALRIAVDRQALTDIVLGPDGGVPTCDSPVWSGDPYRWVGDCKQDIEGAKKLLADAGFPDGIDVEIFTSDVEDHMVDLVQAYQEQVKPAGIRVKLTMADASGYWDDVWMKEPAFVDSWGQRPAAQVLNEVFRSTATWNPTGQQDTELDAMLDEARSTADATQRNAKYQAIQQHMFENTAIFIPYHKTLVRVMSAKVKGIDPIVIDAVRWEKIEVG
jgi:peptide/nickel transport system substrate-binding protein